MQNVSLASFGCQFHINIIVKIYEIFISMVQEKYDIVNIVDICGINYG